MHSTLWFQSAVGLSSTARSKLLLAKVLRGIERSEHGPCELEMLFAVPSFFCVGGKELRGEIVGEGVEGGMTERV